MAGPGEGKPLAAAGRAGEAGGALRVGRRAGGRSWALPRGPRQPAAQGEPGARRRALRRGRARRPRRAARRRRQGRRRQPPLPDGHRRGQAGPAAEPRQACPVSPAVTEALAPVTAAACPSGEVVSEGDTQLNAARSARQIFGVDGSGVTVGILSDSFDQATEAADGSGRSRRRRPTTSPAATCPAPARIPAAITTPVDVLEDDIGRIRRTRRDEGRAMAQIVHDLAPGANIEFASAFNGEDGLRQQHRRLAASRRRGDRRRRLLLRRALLPGRPGRGRGRRSRRTAASPTSPPPATTTSSTPKGTTSPPGKRPNTGMPEAARRRCEANSKRSHCLDFDPGSQTDTPSGSKSPAERP